MRTTIRRTNYDVHNTYTVFCRGRSVAWLYKFSSNNWVIAGPAGLVDETRYYRRRDIKEAIEKLLFANML